MTMREYRAAAQGKRNGAVRWDHAVPFGTVRDGQLSSMRPRRERLRMRARCDFLRALTQGFSK